MNNYIKQLTEIAIDSKYTRWYVSIVGMKLRSSRTLEYAESHHILPKCFKLGGDSDKMNLVQLTPKEHFVCHWLLSKMFESKRKTAQMNKAMTMFFKCNDHQNRRLTSVEYETLRRKSAEANVFFHTGSKRTNETKANMRANNKSALESTKVNIRESKLERYGDENYNNRDKAKETCMVKYGSSTPSGSKEVKDKAKQTRLEKYGNENYVNVSKQKSTNVERYGASVKANAKITCPHCNHETILSWFNRKHKDKQCLRIQ